MALLRGLGRPLGLLSLLVLLVGCNFNYNYSEGYGKPSVSVTPLPGLPATATLVSVSFADSSHGWAAAANCPNGPTVACRGLMFRTTDGGQHWASALPSLLTPRKVQFADATNGWLIGSIGQNCGSQVCPNQIMMSTDGGLVWERASAVNVELLDLGVVSASDVWVLGRLCPEPGNCHATIATTGSAGQMWENRAVPLKGLDFGLQRLDARTAWIVALANAGQTAAPSQPRLASTADAGKTWASADSPCPGSEQGFTFNSASEGWLFCQASSGLQAYRTTDAARTWQPLGLIEPSNPTAATALTLAGVTRLSDQVAVAALNDGTIAITRDGGKSWKQALAAGEPLQGVERHGAADVWVLGNRQIYRSADAGQTWTTQTLDYHPA